MWFRARVWPPPRVTPPPGEHCCCRVLSLRERDRGRSGLGPAAHPVRCCGSRRGRHCARPGTSQALGCCRSGRRTGLHVRVLQHGAPEPGDVSLRVLGGRERRHRLAGLGRRVHAWWCGCGSQPLAGLVCVLSKRGELVCRDAVRTGALASVLSPSGTGVVSAPREADSREDASAPEPAQCPRLGDCG